MISHTHPAHSVHSSVESGGESAIALHPDSDHPSAPIRGMLLAATIGVVLWVAIIWIVLQIVGRF